MSTKTTEQYISEANIIHNNFYDYSLVDYKNNMTKVKIICPIHGVFEQIASDHLRGCGCSYCKNNYRMSTESFINKSNKIYDNFYDYSLVDYKNNKTKVKIICPIHGVFEQRPDMHLQKHGCLKCYNDKIKKLNIFINRSNEIHHNKYNYNLVEYENCYTKVKIICPIHGEFIQTPNNHLKNGCPICKESKGEMKIREFLENHNIKYEYQKIFEDCKLFKNLIFDFYLPNLNTCVEYNGKQHYESINFFGGVDTLIKIKERDKVKMNYCKNNNINLYIIKYSDNIEIKLIRFLNIIKL